MPQTTHRRLMPGEAHERPARCRIPDTGRTIPASGREEYVFTDGAPVAGTENRYWVVEVSRTGLETRYGPLRVAVPLFERLRLGPAVPNPLHAETRLSLAGRSDAIY